MPGKSYRTFQQLLRAFGLTGAGEDLRFELSRLVLPVVDADDYDPPPVYGYSILVPAVAGEFAYVEIKALTFLRIISLTTRFNEVVLRTRGDFTGGGVPFVTAKPPFSSDGSRPDIEIQTGSSVVQQTPAYNPPTNNFPPIVPLHWVGGLVLRFEGKLVGVDTEIDVALQSQRPAG